MRAVSKKLTIVVLVLLPTVLQAQELFIAGVHPGERPANAPVVTDYPKDAAWYERALHGITEPHPDSLRFLESQGAWFTPFDRPGMTGPYDIRDWH